MKSREKNINLCLATRLFYPYYSGGALRFMRYLPGLKERRIQTKVFTGTPSLERARAYEPGVNWQSTPIGKILPVEEINEVPVYRVRLPDVGTRRGFFLYGRYLSHYCRHPDTKPDVIQFMPLPLWSSPWLFQLKRLNIVTVLGYNLLDQFSSNPLKRKLQSYYWRLPFQVVDCVIVNSEAMRETLHTQRITSRIEVIPNGVDLQRFRPQTAVDRFSPLRREFGLNSEDTLIINVGAIEPRKGTDLLLAAWVLLAKQYPGCHLVIVGPRPDLSDPTLADFHLQLEHLVAASGAVERVHFVGYVENVEDYLKASDIFVFTSRREGLPNVVFEAMATGLPVLMTPFVGISDELGRAGEEYLLVEPDPKVISAALSRLITDENSRIQLGQKARTWVETHMNLEASLDSYAKLYRELCVN